MVAGGAGCWWFCPRCALRVIGFGANFEGGRVIMVHGLLPQQCTQSQVREKQNEVARMIAQQDAKVTYAKVKAT